MDEQAQRTQGHLLRIYMAHAGIKTGTALAEAVGVSRQSVSAWLSDSAAISPETLGQLAEVLHLETMEVGTLALAASRIGGAR